MKYKMSICAAVLGAAAIGVGLAYQANSNFNELPANWDSMSTKERIDWHTERRSEREAEEELALFRAEQIFNKCLAKYGDYPTLFSQCMNGDRD